MARLPDELVEQIAEHLDANRCEPKDRKSAQDALSRLARTNKRFHGLLSAVLYARPFLSSPTAVKVYLRIFTSLVDPWKRAKAGRNWPVKVLKPQQLTLESNREWTYLLPPPLPNFPPSVNALNLFSNLTDLVVSSCSFASDFLPLLLGPDTSARQSLSTIKLRNLGLPMNRIGGNRDYEHTLAFLFEAYNLIPFDWSPF
ncbi:hypothetical protein JCM8547_003838 [Rhodosporidiobolus lusitaniae]